MRKSIIGVSIVVIIASAIYALNATNVLASSIFSTKEFSDHTYVGPFSVSNVKVKKAKEQLATDFALLQQQMQVDVIYQDYSFVLPEELITFDVEQSIEQAESGMDNPIIAHVNQEGLETVLRNELAILSLSDASITAIAKGIEGELVTGIIPQTVDLVDYIQEEDKRMAEVATATYNMSHVSPSFSRAIKALNEVTIEPFETISLLELLTQSSVGALTEDEMHMIASSLYTAVLQTNFTIDERTIGSSLSNDVKIGFDATINEALNLDLKFTNPNRSTFILKTTWQNGDYHLSIEGLPFYYTYEPFVLEEEKFDFRTIIQYSAFVNRGQVILAKEGKEGVEATVHRTISHNGDVVTTELIAKDFYAPQARVELHPLQSETTSSNTNNTTNENSSATGENGQNGANEGSSTVGEGSNEDGQDSSSIGNQVETPVGKPPATGESNQNGNNEPEYDKSGLPLTSK